MKQGLLWEHVVPAELAPSVPGGCPAPQPCPLYGCWSHAGATLGGRRSVGSLRWLLPSWAEQRCSGRAVRAALSPDEPSPGCFEGAASEWTETRMHSCPCCWGDADQFSDRALFPSSKDLKAVEGLVFSFRFIPHSPPFSVSLCLSLCWRERKKEGGREPSGLVSEAADKPLLQRLWFAWGLLGMFPWTLFLEDCHRRSGFSKVFLILEIRQT